MGKAVEAFLGAAAQRISLEREPHQRSKLDSVAAEISQLDALLRQADNAGVNLTIIDTAPHSSADAAIAAKLSDFILIPCRPVRVDFDAIASTLEIAKAANTPAAVIINAASTRGSSGEKIDSLIMFGVFARL